MEVKKDGTKIQSLQIGIQIIDVIAKERRPLKFTEIQERTKMTKSNLYKYLNTLVYLDMLYRDNEFGTYVLGPRLIEYGLIASDQENLLERIQPFLDELNKKSSCSITVAVWTEKGPIVIRLYNNNPGFNIGVRIGTYLPGTSSVGKIFLAFQDEQRLKKWKEEEWGKLAPSEREELEKEIEQIRGKKIAFSHEPIVRSVSSIAFPVLNFQGKIAAAVAVVGFKDQIPMDENSELGQYILDISKRISASLGYQM